MATAGDGTAAIVSANLELGSTVQLVAPGGRLGARRRFAQYVPDGTLLVAEDGSAGFGEGELAAGPDGTIALFTPRGLLERRPGEATFARTHRPLTHRYADPQVAVGPGGRIGVTAVDRPLCVFEYGCVGRIVLAERPPGAARFTAPRQAPVARHPVDDGKRAPSGNTPRLAYGSGGAPVLTWTEDVRICTECDLDGPEGPRIVWRPGGQRAQLTRQPSGAELTPLGDGVGIAVASFVSEGYPASERPPGLFLASGGRATLLAEAGAFPWEAGDLLVGGPTRLLVAHGGSGDPIRAALGTVGR